MAEGIEAVVLRTLRYGEADVIAHVFTRDGGRRGVIAKGARKPRSRLGARLEPSLACTLQLVDARGDLAAVRGVDVLEAHEHLRASWRAQQIAAVALDLVSRLTIEHQPNEPVYHLLRIFLIQLDADSGAGGEHGDLLLAAFELKLMHVIGIAPQLGTCVRCGEPERGVAAFSAPDGGVVCRGCRTDGDVSIDSIVHGAAVQLMRTPLADLALLAPEQQPAARTMRTISSSIIAATCIEHAGVRPRTAG